MLPSVVRTLPVLLLVVTGAAAQAQYQGGGGMGGRGGHGGGMGGGRGAGGMGRTYEAPPNPSAKDVEKQDPVELLLDKHKKLKLDKDQITALHALDATLRSQNGPYYQRVDSLHNTFKAPSGGFQRSTGSDGGRGSMMANRQVLYETLLQLRTNNRTARDSALALLSEPQKKKASDMLEKQLEESDKMLREPGRGAGMGGGRRGEPPA
ncbi:MAG TPA: hypothetical protein VFW03_06470 [Gemmatimonadaceae bacterium]|nr:hypothetical protein [Gemmatimonadaceae bacterium]